MVLTRSRAASPSQTGASSRDTVPPSPSVEEVLEVVEPSSGAARGVFAAGAALNIGASPPPSAMSATGPSLACAQPAAAGAVMLTNEQLMLLLNRISKESSVSTTISHNQNFSKCTARFNGEESSDVLAFIDAVETYKECARVEDDIALRGLSMLLTDLAATWWQGVKATTLSWSDAISALKNTFGPRLPPHQIYRKMFEREQRHKESTDLFVCHLRALIAQLPPRSLTEEVQLDMVYGLLHVSIREKVPRTCFNTFGELLTEARRVEDILRESHPPSSSTSSPSSPSAASMPSDKKRLHCVYCKQYGHLKETCQRLKDRKPKEGNVDNARLKPNITCFGCGAPGVIRSNCMTCKVKKETVASAFQSVSASVVTLGSRGRPIIGVSIYGERGKLLVDTGAKHSIGSVSLKRHLCKNGHTFETVFTELKYADGRSVAQNVEVAHVDVKVRGIVVTVSFIMLPSATESLLGMNFIQSVGMVLDFDLGLWYVRQDRTPQPLCFESVSSPPLGCASVGLREDEGSHLVPHERDRLSTLLNSHEDIFTPGGGPTKFAQHRIDTGDAVPIAGPPYRVSPAKKEIIRKELDKMLEEGVIEEAESEWAAPVVLIPKKNGEIRFCVDYRKLNHVTRTDQYPIPVIDELLKSTKANCVMSTIDLKAGYWQTEVAPEDRHKTAFTTPFGTFQFRRMPFGLKNAPATFQRLMDRMRSGLKDVCVLTYLDDILVISQDLDRHLDDLQQVFDRLRLFNLKANRDKCVFARERITYLGHVISAQGIEPDPSKVEAVVSMKPPKNLKELKTFLQTCSWFRKFIPQFSEVARSLTDLTKKDRRWQWGETENKAFEELKLRLSTSPVLRQPDFNEPFILRTDASAFALGAVLMQGPTTTEERPIEYASRLLTSAERNYHTTEREALAVVWALEKFRGYVEGARVQVATDHQPLRWLLSLKTPSGRLARWAMKIQSYDLDIGYTPGRVNVVADTLSRPVIDEEGEPAPEPCNVCPVVVDLPHRGPEDIRTAQIEDPEIKGIIEDFEDSANPDAAMRWTDRGFYLSQGVLYRCDPDGESEEPQLVVPESLRTELMQELHDAPTAGHLGIERTLKRIKERFYFKGMRAFVTKYLKSCDECQRYKATNLKPAGLLQTPVLHQRFEVLAMDLFGPLPEGPRGEKWILLVEDTASRWVELFALCDSTAETCAKILIEEVFLRYGIPRRVVSDNGSQFVSAVMQKVMYVLGVQQTLIPVYHPEANPAERKNRELKQLLAILVGPEHRRWPTVLPAVRFALNSAHNIGTGQSAAYLTFARELRSPMSVHTDIRAIVSKQNFVPQITPYLKDFARILVDVKRRVEDQQDVRKAVGDRRRRDVTPYKEGDLVLVSTHLASNVAKGFTSKFAPRREGPYRVSKVVTPTSFEIVDSDGGIRGKYHASALTPYVGDGSVIRHPRRRGRPAKSRSGRPGDLEGEVIASTCRTPLPRASHPRHRWSARLANQRAATVTL